MHPISLENELIQTSIQTFKEILNEETASKTIYLDDKSEDFSFNLSLNI
jgi:hypothetical protein